MYKLLFSKDAKKDATKIKQSKLEIKCQTLLDVVATDPFTMIPPFEKLVGGLHGYYSRRINIKHRLIYEVDEHNQLVKILRMWSHYE